MAKKQRKEFVWQQPHAKIRKKRQTKIKQANISQIQQVQQAQCSEKNSQIQELAVSINDKASILDIIEDVREMKESQQNQQINEKVQVRAIDIKKQADLEQRLKVIKQILFREQGEDGIEQNIKLDHYRQNECNQIIDFLANQSHSFSILYIYGTPGIGKTFTIKKLLAQYGNKTKWINCLNMMNKSLLRYVEPQIQRDQRKTILVIDEFDQMQGQFKNFKFIQSFKVYLKEIIKKAFVPSLKEIKFIFISNKSYQSINQDFILAIKDFLKFDFTTEIPFLPYTCEDIASILKIKAKAVHSALGMDIFSQAYIQISAKKEYPKSQDIRKIIAHIFCQYEQGEMKKISSVKENKKLSGQKLSVEAQFIVRMSEIQRRILKSLLQASSKAAKQNRPLLVQSIYRFGVRNNITERTVDLWLQEWSESGLIILKSHNKDGHHLYKTMSIVTHLKLDECQIYFY